MVLTKSFSAEHVSIWPRSCIIQEKMKVFWHISHVACTIGQELKNWLNLWVTLPHI